jgi:phenylacetate-coenzyme A ligase PaaK-like adenylate-forming protein
MHKTPLETWIATKIFGDSRPSNLAQEDIRGYQLEKLKKTIEYARSKSPFYGELLRDFDPERLKAPEDVEQFPFTAPADLQERGPDFLCVSQSEIPRVVTLQIPGVTGKPRRLYFTEDDLELTTDFFHHGMSTIVESGHKVLILMPGDRPGSIGDLLVQALGRMGARGTVHGLVQDPSQVIREIVHRQIDSLVGIPAQMHSIIRHDDAGLIPRGQIKSVLLSTDYVSSAIVQELQQAWGCRVVNHYGTTEMGFGGALQCHAANGYHIREADLYFEIVDPLSGKPQPAGRRGEIVFTTLTRKGMPLIRYRTGDLTRFLPDPCPCGAVVPLLDTVRGRWNEFVRVGNSLWLGITDLDEVLFRVPGLLNYRAAVANGPNRDRLDITVSARVAGGASELQDAVHHVLMECDVVSRAMAAGSLSLGDVVCTTELWPTTTLAKRTIKDQRTGGKSA